jgi:pimeloyl-ACP methyl ester carboxylesterase
MEAKAPSLWSTLVVLVIVLPHPSRAAMADGIEPTSREVYTCEDEEKYFSGWSAAASLFFSEERLVRKYPQAHLVTVPMGDGRSVRGLHFPASGNVLGAVLVIPGNAWRVGQFARYAEFLTANHLDAYMFDFRGYALSRPGIPTVSAIVADFKEIGSWLASKGHPKLYLYSFSFGGVLALNAFPQGPPFTRIVLDSAPSRTSQMGFQCKPSYDPVDVLPGDCSHLIVMHGTSDGVLPREWTQELISAVSSCGGTIDTDKPRGHPFQMEWLSSRRSRLADVCRHFGVSTSGSRPQ